MRSLQLRTYPYKVPQMDPSAKQTLDYDVDAMPHGGDVWDALKKMHAPQVSSIEATALEGLLLAFLGRYLECEA